MKQVQANHQLAENLDAPSWAQELAGVAETLPCDVGGVRLQRAASGQYGLITVTIENARALDREALSNRVDWVYQTVADLLAGSPAPYPIRFWNHICHIHEPMGDGMDRYMAFNVGRFRAFSRRFGDRQNFDRAIATASGVGCHGNDIRIHALSSARAGIPVANPRQVQPFRYSQRFGPRPPCFSRATLLETERPMLLIGGTASIRGEESMFIGDLEAQMDETVVNLAALVEHAGSIAKRPATLGSITDLRIYLPNMEHSDTVLAAARRAIPNAGVIQIQRAELCRKELMVEIEGRAELA